MMILALVALLFLSAHAKNTPNIQVRYISLSKVEVRDNFPANSIVDHVATTVNREIEIKLRQGYRLFAKSQQWESCNGEAYRSFIFPSTARDEFIHSLSHSSKHGLDIIQESSSAAIRCSSGRPIFAKCDSGSLSFDLCAESGIGGGDMQSRVPHTLAFVMGNSLYILADSLIYGDNYSTIPLRLLTVNSIRIPYSNSETMRLQRNAPALVQLKPIVEWEGIQSLVEGLFYPVTIQISMKDALAVTLPLQCVQPIRIVAETEEKIYDLRIRRIGPHFLELSLCPGRSAGIHIDEFLRGVDFRMTIKVLHLAKSPVLTIKALFV